MGCLTSIGNAMIAVIRWFSGWCGRTWKRGKGGKWAVGIVLLLLFACPCSLVNSVFNSDGTPTPTVTSEAVAASRAEPDVNEGTVTEAATESVFEPDTDERSVTIEIDAPTVEDTATMTATKLPTDTPAPSSTPEPTDMPAATATMAQMPTETSTATLSPTPASTQTPVPTWTPRPTPMATATHAAISMKLIEDVTVDDNTVMALGESFVKTWRIQNTGTERWSTATVLKHVAGLSLADVNKVPAPQLAAGEIGDVSVEMVAPAMAGIYKSEWALHDGQSERSASIYVLILVQEPVQAEVYYYIGATGECYHREDCRTLKNTKTRVTCEWIRANGRRACKICKPPPCPQ